ncbi:hypothetical protein [Jiulongibacter sp. NS-SX5]|uniref:hypothetical protein n=1 Tax=Jiulongibacter sp. NS-SX5 TaxID=3463854 RepID=UPI0040589139
MLIKTIIREYYRENVGFYLFIVLFFFGFMKSSDHLQLINVLISKPIFLFAVALFWLVHVLKTSYYFHQKLQDPAFGFLQTYRLHALDVKKWKGLLIAQVGFNLPFLLYAIAMMAIALQQSNFYALVILLLVNCLLIILPSIYLNRRLMNFITEKSKSIHFDFMPGWPQFYFTRHLMQSKWLLLISSKLYTCFLLVGGARLFLTDDYDFRLLGLSTFLALIGLFALAKEKVAFEEQKLNFRRGFPKGIGRKFIGILKESFLFLIPEIILTAYNWWFYVSLFHLVGALILLIAALTLWNTFYYSSYAYSKESSKGIFAVDVIVFLFIMFKVPLIILAFSFFALSWFILKKNYYKFELSQLIPK